jgi:hypothetical protein
MAREDVCLPATLGLVGSYFMHHHTPPLSALVEGTMTMCEQEREQGCMRMAVYKGQNRCIRGYRSWGGESNLHRVVLQIAMHQSRKVNHGML